MTILSRFHSAHRSSRFARRRLQSHRCSRRAQGKAAVTQARLTAARAAATGRPRYAAIAFRHPQRPCCARSRSLSRGVADRRVQRQHGAVDRAMLSLPASASNSPQRSRWRSSPHLKAKRRNVSETRGQRFGGCEWMAARRRRRAARAVSAGQVGAAY